MAQFSNDKKLEQIEQIWLDDTESYAVYILAESLESFYWLIEGPEGQDCEGQFPSYKEAEDSVLYEIDKNYEITELQSIYQRFLGNKNEYILDVVLMFPNCFYYLISQRVAENLYFPVKGNAGFRTFEEAKVEMLKVWNEILF